MLTLGYSLQLGAAAKRIAGILADRGVDVSGRTIPRWVQKPSLCARRSAGTGSEHDLAGGCNVRENPGQEALPASRCR